MAEGTARPTGPGGVTRREFLVNAFVAVSALLAVGTLAQRFLAFLTPPAPPERDVEVLAASLAAIPDGGGTVVRLPSGHVALERTGDSVRAFSAVCTHLGCVVQPDPEHKAAWYCPCHHGRYDRAGRVVSGPPPRPLPPLPAAVRDGQVFVTLRLRAPTVVT